MKVKRHGKAFISEDGKLLLGPNGIYSKGSFLRPDAISVGGKTFKFSKTITRQKKAKKPRV